MLLRGYIFVPEGQEHVVDWYEGVSHGTGQYGPEIDEHCIKKNYKNNLKIAQDTTLSQAIF